VNALAWTDTGLTANTTYTYFVKATNAVGTSSATAGVDVTTATANPQLGGVTWSCQNIATKTLNAVLGGTAMLYPGTLKSVANGGVAAGWVDVAPSAQTDFDLLKDGVSVGTLRWAAAANAPTLIKAANTALVFDDYVDLKTPSNLNGMSGVFRAGVTIAR
jgi:hypothetical protein